MEPIKKNIEHFKYPKIYAFKNVLSDIYRNLEDGDYPTIEFEGRVKIHGTNAAVSLNDGELYTQSRNGFFDNEVKGGDSYGFATFVQEQEISDFLKYKLAEVKSDWFKNDWEKALGSTAVVYGEWAGEGIQKNVGVSQLAKTFYVFGVSIFYGDGVEISLDSSSFDFSHDRIKNITDYPMFKVSVDMKDPKVASEILEEITMEVERECPVSRAHGVKEGVGEGVVWKGWHKGEEYVFKTKGQKHSVVNSKNIAPIASKNIAGCLEFTEYAVTKNRVLQACEQVIPSDESVGGNMRYMGDLIRWVINDIFAEESDVMKAGGITQKEVGKFIAKKTKDIFVSL